MTRQGVLLVEDDANTRARLARVIGAHDRLLLLGEAGSCAEARALFERVRPQVLLTDLGLPDGTGIALIREARGRFPDVLPLVITVFGDEQHVVSSIEAGATGYILKDSAPADVISCIRLLRAGGSPVSPVVARSVLRAIRNRMGSTAPARAPGSEQNPLSARETEILQLLAKGMSFNEIGEILGISPHTVTAHLKKIYRKLAVHSRGEAVYEATQMGLLKS